MKDHPDYIAGYEAGQRGEEWREVSKEWDAGWEAWANPEWTDADFANAAIYENGKLVRPATGEKGE